MFEAYVCDKIRTRDLLVRSQTLYPAELHTHPANVSPIIVRLRRRSRLRKELYYHKPALVSILFYRVFNAYISHF